jgi:hypothetical protein
MRVRPSDVAPRNCSGHHGWRQPNKAPADAGLAAFGLDIKINVGTNKKAETPAFVRQFTTSALPAPIHGKSYVLAHTADGGTNGYGGRAQNAR